MLWKSGEARREHIYIITEHNIGSVLAQLSSLDLKESSRKFFQRLVEFFNDGSVLALELCKELIFSFLLTGKYLNAWYSFPFLSISWWSVHILVSLTFQEFVIMVFRCLHMCFVFYKPHSDVGFMEHDSVTVKRVNEEGEKVWNSN